MKAANVVLLNFHDMGARVARWMELTEVVRTPEEMQAKELQRAKNQNPGLQRHKADDGVPALGRYGEANVCIDMAVQDLLDAGFKLIEAYKEHTFKTRWDDDGPHVTDEKIGTISRFVFSKDPTSVAVLDPETAEKKLARLFEGLRDSGGYICPCAHVFPQLRRRQGHPNHGHDQPREAQRRRRESSTPGRPSALHRWYVHDFASSCRPKTPSSPRLRKPS